MFINVPKITLISRPILIGKNMKGFLSASTNIRKGFFRVSENMKRIMSRVCHFGGGGFVLMGLYLDTYIITSFLNKYTLFLVSLCRE